METDSRKLARKRAKQRGYIFISCCIAVVLAVISLVSWLAVAVIYSFKDNPADTSSAISDISSTQDSGTPSAPSQNPSTTSSTTSEKPNKDDTPQNKEPKYVQRGNYKLDANYTDLLLVNGSHPLPQNYDYTGNLTTIDNKYRQPGYDLNQINKNVYPYLQAMCEAAWADGVDLKVCSPYRSYSIQETLFNRQVQKWINNGYSEADADAKAATIVARPGTSEHHTGLAIDFIMANDGFEKLPAFGWLQEHAAEYGFIMRYPKEKQPITGVIYESWHYRFVGISEAQKIKESGLCLEEYLAQ